MAFLFDTDAISELLRPHPLASYVEWLGTIPREEQFTSPVVIGELYKGACRSSARERHLANIEARVLPAVTVLPYDSASAHIFGEVSARLEGAGTMLADTDLQIASTAIHHGLSLVTGNIRHFERIPGIRLYRILAESRKSQ